MSSSIALISCTDNAHTFIGCNARPYSDKDKDVFTTLLSRRAPRQEVELFASLIHSAHDDNLREFGPSQISSVTRSLEQDGKYLRGWYAIGVYRVKSIDDAMTILRKGSGWHASDFDDKVQQYFQRYPNVTVAIMENDDQRILFFDEVDRLVAYRTKYNEGPTEDGFWVRDNQCIIFRTRIDEKAAGR
jgi:hypothetical protein